MKILVFDEAMDMTKYEMDFFLKKFEKAIEKIGVKNYIYYTFDENLNIFQVIKKEQLENLEYVVCVPEKINVYFLQNLIYPSLEYFDLI